MTVRRAVPNERTGTPRAYMPVPTAYNKRAEPETRLIREVELWTHTDGAVNWPSNSTVPTVLGDELVGLLADVAREEPYYEPSIPTSTTYKDLCKLESLGYVHYCPYPEDFWILLPAGRQLLSRFRP